MSVEQIAGLVREAKAAYLAPLLRVVLGWAATAVAAPLAQDGAQLQLLECCLCDPALSGHPATSLDVYRPSGFSMLSALPSTELAEVALPRSHSGVAQSANRAFASSRRNADLHGSLHRGWKTASNGDVDDSESNPKSAGRS